MIESEDARLKNERNYFEGNQVNAHKWKQMWQRSHH